MKIEIIIDNDTLDEKLIPEEGFSALVTEDNKKILFDTGRNGNVINNAKKMGIDLTDIDYIVFSHGHHDHTNGLCDILNLYKNKEIPKQNRPQIIAHYDAFFPRSDKDRYIGTKLTREEIEDDFEVIYTSSPKWLINNLLFLGKIPRKNSFEAQKPLGKITRGAQEDDFINDDTALVYKSSEGLVVISGCSHAGICNILDYAIQTTGEDKIVAIIGGLHLKNETPEFIAQTIEALKKYKIKELHACHCTGDLAKEMLKENLPQKDVGCSFTQSYD